MDTLTPRELELARLVALGKCNKDIAKLLGITAQTVRNHVRSIFKKLAVRNRVQLTLCLSKQPSHGDSADFVKDKYASGNMLHVPYKTTSSKQA